MCLTKETYLLPWTIILAMETLAIIFGNAVTILVFWKRKRYLKGTVYLLMNLSFADLMVGVSSIENLVGEIWKLTASTCHLSWDQYVALEELFGCASISSLVLISIERMHAIVWPFRHRAISSRKYIFSIGVVWLISGIVAALRMLNTSNFITNAVFFRIGAVYLIVSLLLISSAYYVIWLFCKRQDPRLPINRQKQNKKLANILLIVTLLSLMTWLPFAAMYVLESSLQVLGAMATITGLVTRFFRLANSFINPIIYSFRMPEFRATFKTLFCRRNVSRLHMCDTQQGCPEKHPAVLIRFTNLVYSLPKPQQALS